MEISHYDTKGGDLNSGIGFSHDVDLAPFPFQLSFWEGSNFHVLLESIFSTS